MSTSSSGNANHPGSLPRHDDMVRVNSVNVVNLT